MIASIAADTPPIGFIASPQRLNWGQTLCDTRAHTNSERLLIKEGHLEQDDAAILNVYMANPGLAETIDPDFCTCYVCDDSFVQKDAMERHFMSQHGAPANLIKDIAAAIRGKKINLSS
jgi:hypothetical protein